MAQAEQPDSYDDELSRIDASIAELKVRDMAAAKERTQIASKIQAAQFQRDILAHANSQKKAKKTAKRQRPRRTDFGPPPHTSGPPPEWSAPGTPATGPQGVATDGATLLVDDPPPTETPVATPSGPPRRPRVEPLPPPPEASSQSVQNILLAVGALLVGVAAVVFATVASVPPPTPALMKNDTRALP